MGNRRKICCYKDLGARDGNWWNKERKPSSQRSARMSSGQQPSGTPPEARVHEKQGLGDRIAVLGQRQNW